jgi:hypothetical protein
VSFPSTDPNAPPRMLWLLVVAAIVFGIAAAVWVFNSIS